MRGQHTELLTLITERILRQSLCRVQSDTLNYFWNDCILLYGRYLSGLAVFCFWIIFPLMDLFGTLGWQDNPIHLKVALTTDIFPAYSGTFEDDCKCSFLGTLTSVCRGKIQSLQKSGQKKAQGLLWPQSYCLYHAVDLTSYYFPTCLNLWEVKTEKEDQKTLS